MCIVYINIVVPHTTWSKRYSSHVFITNLCAVLISSLRYISSAHFWFLSFTLLTFGAQSDPYSNCYFLDSHLMHKAITVYRH